MQKFPPTLKILKHTHILGTTLSYKSGRELRPERVIRDTLPQQLASRVAIGSTDDISLVENYTQKEMSKVSESGRVRGQKLATSDLHKNATRIALLTPFFLEGTKLLYKI